VPDMDSRDAGRLLIAALQTDPPHGARVDARLVRATPWWTTDATGPAFDAAARALEAGYGKKAAFIGAGGSIGFVQPFTDHLPGVPCLLVGVEDPPCNAHSENESLHLGDWRRCMRSAVHLYDELAALGVPERTVRR
jgi:cysteinylglycine-S-conjugate dipeptidase